MKDETIEFIEYVVQEEYGRSLYEHEKELLKNLTKDSKVIMPRHNGRTFTEGLIRMGLFYEAWKEEDNNER